MLANLYYHKLSRNCSAN